jgi:hypothetical protein
MCYWGAQPLNLGTTTEPLVRFLSKLAKAGRNSAMELYHVVGPHVNNQGKAKASSSSSTNQEGEVKAAEEEQVEVEVGPWVAHGYVDINIDANPHGDLQWSLCPTCGAWAALQLWDNFLYEQVYIIGNIIYILHICIYIYNIVEHIDKTVCTLRNPTFLVLLLSIYISNL